MSIMRKCKIIKTSFSFVIILHSYLVSTSYAAHLRPQRCLTGYMTDVQSWVDDIGVLQVDISKISDAANSIDLSSRPNPVHDLYKKMTQFRSGHFSVKYLSMARCKLSRVPPIFEMQDTSNRSISVTIEYITFFGNTFRSYSEPGEQYGINFNATNAVEVAVEDMYRSAVTPLWSAGFQEIEFPRLKELDLRACYITVINANAFKGMKNLEALYIGENQISFIDPHGFMGLNKLVHLDISGNDGFEDNGRPRNALVANFIFNHLPNLRTLDLSYTKLAQRNIGVLRGLGKSLKSLSVCETGLTNLAEGMFKGTSLQVLDISRNNGILSNNGALKGLENSLQVLNANDVGLRTMDIFENFTKLEIVQLANNEIVAVKPEIAKTLTHLAVLDLNKNRMTMWFEPTFSLIPKLKILSIKDNNINVIMKEMVEDVTNIEYLALTGNFIVCNCHAKDLYKMAYMNEMKANDSVLTQPKNQPYNRAYEVYNSKILKRNSVKYDCGDQCEELVRDSGVIRLLDYSTGAYTCLMVPDSKSVMFSEVDGCSRIPRDIDYDTELAEGRNMLLVLIAIPCVLLPAAAVFVFRSNIRYCIITIRNSAMIGLINKYDAAQEGTIFNYDVFVSYCDEDRGWVLDHLLPHMEAECSISACLHERDFQVGLSILENIVSCMDRSRSIMLIISRRFLLSQWCQFEMHLAQHRLLETRREDLTLVLLEDIPRRLRPNTLHYLMLTKTYIVWPQEESNQPVFWKRLKKSLLSQKVKQNDNVSLA